jgi:hypothetical protein
MSARLLPSLCALFALAFATLLGACSGCKSAASPHAGDGDDGGGAPTLRLYLVSDMAGALEPCGCTKDQLGGMDHFGAYVTGERGAAPASVVAAAGPLFFMDPALKPDHKDQDVAKAHAIAHVFGQLGFAAFAPSQNEQAAGADELSSLAKDTGGALLDAGARAVRDVGGAKVCFVGVGPASAADATAEEQAATQVRGAVDACKKEGAKLFVALSSIGRGPAKRLADRVPELHVIVVGDTKAAGDLNGEAAAPELIGKTLVVQAANHLQSVSVLDFFVRDGSYDFADATGVERERQRQDLSRRIDDLHIKISNWERDAKIPAADLAARKADLQKLEQERAALDVAPPPASGSYFRFATKEIRVTLGTDPRIAAALGAYYKDVNDHNKVAFAGRKPPPAAPDQASYIGVEACTECHAEERAFWNGTKHAHAYATLSKEFKEFNLDCVGCHVSGYDKPGGAAVVGNELLQNVQCESCHGPGSKHAKEPYDNQLITEKPQPTTCVSCHHPPHVEQFDPNAKREEIIGPGHGMPLDAGVHD